MLSRLSRPPASWSSAPLLRRAFVAVVLGVIVLGGGAPPASAHGGVAFEPAPSSNWRSRVTSFDSSVAGLSATVIDAGEQVQVTNSSPQTVTVIGYENEPYLRIGPDGVFENVRSPATYLNRSGDGSAPVPDTADASAEPEWRQVTGGDTISWHDHRAHWMAVEPPPIVAEAPEVERVVYDRWTIPIEVDGQRFEVVGDLTWVPAPTAWPWILAVVVLAAAFAAIGFTSRWRTAIRVGAVVLLTSCAVDIVGTWWGSTDPTIERAAALVTPSISFAFLIAGLVYLDRRRNDALLLIFGGAAGVTVFFGWLSRGFLVNSQIPSALAPNLARLTVVLALGIGIGLMLLVVALHREAIRAAAPGRSPAPVPGSTRARKAPIGARARTNRAPEDSRDRRLGILAASTFCIVILGAGVAVFASRISDSSTAAEPAERSAPTELSVALCSAIEGAADGDTNAARRTFGEIHDGLHELAKTEAERDRASSARLLEAKQRVESDLATSPVTLTDDLRSLHAVIVTITPPTSDAGRC